VLIFIAVLILCAIGAEWVSLQDPLAKVAYDCRPSKAVVEPEEPFEIITTLQNARRFPVPFIKMEELLPASLEFLPPIPAHRQDKGGLIRTGTLYLMPRQTLQRRQPALIRQRGRYFFRGATLFGGDFLGIRETSKQVHLSKELVVLPTTIDCPLLLENLGGFLGEISVNRFILEDPVLTLGYRDYTGREPQKAISWSQSARAGKLMVKKYDHTLELSVTVILSVDSGTGDHRQDPQEIEHCFSIARAVCETLEDRGVQYGFLTNATAAGAMGCWSLLEEGLGAQHFYTILEGLGRATYDRTQSFAHLLHRAAKRAQQGQAHIIITPALLPEFQPMINRLRDLTGSQITVLAGNNYKASCDPDSQEKADSKATAEERKDG